MLQKLVPRVCEVLTYSGDVEFIRMEQLRASRSIPSSSVVPQGKKLVLSLEYSIPPTTVKPFGFITLGGYLNYTAIIAVCVQMQVSFFFNGYILLCHFLLAMPRLGVIKDHGLAFFVSEAKTFNIPLEGHVPQRASSCV